MRESKVSLRRGRAGLIFLFIFFSGLFTAQAQQGMVPGAKRNKLKGSIDGNISASAAVIQIRSAFTLSSAMVRAIQAGIKDDLAQPNADSLDLVPWNEPLTRIVPLAVPLDVQVTGSNVVVHVQILPTVIGSQIVELIIQGQTWAKITDNTLSFNTTLQTLNIAWGSRFFFYPLGMDSKTGAPIVMEIRVDRQKAQ